MRTLDDYIDAAIGRNPSITSDRELSSALVIGDNAVQFWRDRSHWPIEDSMIALAELAGLDPAAALIDLNIWRCRSNRVRDLYSYIAKIYERHEGTS